MNLWMCPLCGKAKMSRFVEGHRHAIERASCPGTPVLRDVSSLPMPPPGRSVERAPVGTLDDEQARAATERLVAGPSFGELGRGERRRMGKGCLGQAPASGGDVHKQTPAPMAVGTGVTVRSPDRSPEHASDPQHGASGPCTGDGDCSENASAVHVFGSSREIVRRGGHKAPDRDSSSVQVKNAYDNFTGAKTVSRDMVPDPTEHELEKENASLCVTDGLSFLSRMTAGEIPSSQALREVSREADRLAGLLASPMPALTRPGALARYHALAAAKEMARSIALHAITAARWAKALEDIQATTGAAEPEGVTR